MANKNSKAKAYIMLITSVLIFGTIGIFRKSIPLSSATLACTRGFLGGTYLLIVTKLSGKKVLQDLSSKTVVLLILSGVMIGFNWILFFEALTLTTVATATLCYYMSPTMIIMLSPVFLHEKLTIKRLLCAAAAIIGMMLVSGVKDGSFINSANSKGVICGLSAAALYAAIVTLNKRIHVKDANQQTMIQLLSATIVLIPYIWATEGFSPVRLNTVSIVMILILGIVHTGLSYSMYFKSIEHLQAQSVAVLSYIDPVSAMILAALILNETMTKDGIVGAVLIIGSAMISETDIVERLFGKRNRK